MCLPGTIETIREQKGAVSPGHFIEGGRFTPGELMPPTAVSAEDLWRYERFHLPGFGADAAEYLIDRGHGVAIGVDTISLDPGNSTTFPVHVNWLAADHYGIESLARLDKIPRAGAFATMGVVPWEEGSGGPARVLATY